MANRFNNVLQRFMDEYSAAYDEVYKTQNFKHPFGAFIRRDICDQIRQNAGLDQTKYIVKGSCGAGRWTPVPWIAVFDKRITTSAQKGVYIVYLLNKDKKELYLTLNQGATDVSQDGAASKDGKLAFTGIAGSSNEKSLGKLKFNAKKIREIVGSVSFICDDQIKCGALNYDAGAVCYKKYTLDTLPDDEQLYADLQEFISIYSRYAEWYLKGERHCESDVDDHPVGIFDSWEIVDETTAIKTCDKSFFDYNGSGVPKEICWFFDAENVSNGSSKPITLIFNGKEYSGSLKNDTTDRRRIQIRWNSDLGRLFDTYKNEESKATFTKKQTGVYEITLKGGEKEMTIKERVAAIRKYIEAKGFNYDGSLIENFYLGLKSKPFVILAGTSGTGKTRLVKLFAEAIQAKYLSVPVRPDWSDSSDLFGHKDLNGNFIKGAIIDFVKDAIDDKTTPYILCLDEMNLARVEYYMSDILSVIETREFDENKKITSKPLVSKEYCRNSNGRNEYGELQFPGNLYIVGTVNMDETTFPFSKKVLDRANTIEFSYVNLLSMPSFSTATADKITVTNEFLVSKYITLNDCDAADREYIGSVCTTLSRINSILEIANAHIGYRVRDEIVFYMLNNREADLLDDKVAFDNQIMQKILPRIQGSSESIKTMLGELLKICESEKYEASAKKINFMIKRYEEDGFTSYWL